MGPQQPLKMLLLQHAVFTSLAIFDAILMLVSPSFLACRETRKIAFTAAAASAGHVLGYLTALLVLAAAWRTLR